MTPCSSRCPAPQTDPGSAPPRTGPSPASRSSRSPPPPAPLRSSRSKSGSAGESSAARETSPSAPRSQSSRPWPESPRPASCSPWDTPRRSPCPTPPPSASAPPGPPGARTSRSPRHPAHNQQPPHRQVPRQHLRYARPIRRRMPRPHHRNRRPAQQPHISPHPKHRRRIVNLLQPLRILRAAKLTTVAPCDATRAHSASAAVRAFPSKMNCAASAGNLSPSSAVSGIVKIRLGRLQLLHRVQNPLWTQPRRKSQRQPGQPASSIPGPRALMPAVFSCFLPQSS